MLKNYYYQKKKTILNLNIRSLIMFKVTISGPKSSLSPTTTPLYIFRIPLTDKRN